ncbi:hypothetical protein ACM46_22620 [Chryseobacterium angstadtii]|uniref:Uncharacterized protein n=2 Tax=Chryseobacterium angstadtii TaxID=558151 RepID=A0A0J7KMF1_9FLAO|nr:hypothetical protein ACM46_22620 [Chryseobacterium angstadtii]
MLGFYYEGKSLAEIKDNFSVKTPEKEMQNGLVYAYEYNGYSIMECYRQQEKGVIRFISINNSAKQPVDKFRLENSKLFFELNPRLWILN